MTLKNMSQQKTLEEFEEEVRLIELESHKDDARIFYPDPMDELICAQCGKHESAHQCVDERPFYCKIQADIKYKSEIQIVREAAELYANQSKKDEQAINLAETPISKAISEFERLKEKATSIRDMLYLDGVLAVLDTIKSYEVEFIKLYGDCDLENKINAQDEAEKYVGHSKELFDGDDHAKYDAFIAGFKYKRYVSIEWFKHEELQDLVVELPNRTKVLKILVNFQNELQKRAIIEPKNKTFCLLEDYKTELARKYSFYELRTETGGFTPFDRLYDSRTDGGKKAILNELAELIISNQSNKDNVDVPLNNGEPWNTHDVIAKLIEAADILLHKKDYDGHGWEEIEICYNKGKELLEQINKNHEKQFHQSQQPKWLNDDEIKELALIEFPIKNERPEWRTRDEFYDANESDRDKWMDGFKRSQLELQNRIVKGE